MGAKCTKSAVNNNVRSTNADADARAMRVSKIEYLEKQESNGRAAVLHSELKCRYEYEICGRYRCPNKDYDTHKHVIKKVIDEFYDFVRESDQSDHVTLTIKTKLEIQDSSVNIENVYRCKTLVNIFNTTDLSSITYMAYSITETENLLPLIIPRSILIYAYRKKVRTFVRRDMIVMSYDRSIPNFYIYNYYHVAQEWQAQDEYYNDIYRTSKIHARYSICDKCKDFVINQQHCDKCHLSYDRNRFHCCECRMTYDTEFNGQHYTHCCTCKKIYPSRCTVSHCDACHLTYASYCNHCCECKVVYDVGEHCSTCHTLYNKNHCCECKIAYDGNHCCGCKATYINKHCNTCHASYDKNHCDTCHISYNNNHCNTCHISYDNNHCYGCKATYINKHCDTCHISYDKNHCCGCKATYINEHCNTCHISYDKHHCCGCNTNFNNYHCCICKTNYDKFNAGCNCIQDTADMNTCSLCYAENLIPSKHFRASCNKSLICTKCCINLQEHTLSPKCPFCRDTDPKTHILYE